MSPARTIALLLLGLVGCGPTSAWEGLWAVETDGEVTVDSSGTCTLGWASRFDHLVEVHNTPAGLAVRYLDNDSVMLAEATHTELNASFESLWESVENEGTFDYRFGLLTLRQDGTGDYEVSNWIGQSEDNADSSCVIHHPLEVTWVGP